MAPESTEAHYRAQQRLTLATLVAVRAAWKLMTPEFDTSWVTVGPRLLKLLTAAQLGAARSGSAYVPQVLGELDIVDDPAAEFDPASLAGIASDGRPLDSLLYGAITHAKTAAKATIVTEDDVTQMTPGLSATQALERAGTWLDHVVQTQVSDAARVAVQTEIAARPQVAGYTRMLNPPSCSRCAILAGRWYRWNEGFLRHPLCDCRHIPTTEAIAGDLTTSVDRYFDSLDRETQDEIFTKAGAEAIRRGADIGRVVNARRGMTTASIGGREVAVTTERAGRRPRLMPEAILTAASTRDEALRLLKLHGYLT